MNEEGSERLYTARFFRITLAVGVFMTAVSLQFHFGQYLAFLGYDVDVLGRIVSVALIGTLLIRMQLGRWIDRFGCRNAWLAGSATVTGSLAAIQFTQSLWAIALLRATWAMGVAMAMTTVPVVAAHIAPPRRRAECIGSLGVAGFVGMIIGPALGDWIFTAEPISRQSFHIFFTASAACSALGGIAMIAAEWAGFGRTDEFPSSTRVHTSLRSQLHLVRHHWPGIILFVGVTFNMVFCVQSLFLERLAEFGGFANIKVFFFVYCPTAVILRLLFRTLPQTIGRSRTVLAGLLLLTVGLLCLVGVNAEVQLILPGLLMGAGHAFVFPSMIDLAAACFPFEYRGTGTALAFTAGDFGTLIGFLTLGETIRAFGFDRALQFLALICIVAFLSFLIVRRNSVFGRSSV